MDRGMTPEHGFSLVEMMIVVAILSVLSVGATLSIRSRDSTRASDATLLQQAVSELRDQAILSRQPRSLTITTSDLTRWRDDGQGGWTATGTPRPFRGVAQAEPGYGAVVTAQTGLRAVFLPDGRASAFRVSLALGGAGWRCETDGWGPLTCDALR